MGERETLDSARKIVDQYAGAKTKGAITRVEKELHGDGCGCIKCRRDAVTEVNSWIDWHAAENDKLAEYAEELKYSIDDKGKITHGKPKGGAKAY